MLFSAETKAKGGGQDWEVLKMIEYWMDRRMAVLLEDSRKLNGKK
jgi:hypothetical protein